MKLKGPQTRYLRGLGHHLDPVVRIGREGMSDALAGKVLEELRAHELIKLKCGDGCLEDARTMGAVLAERCSASLVQVIGHTFLLYRRNREEPRIELP